MAKKRNRNNEEEYFRINDIVAIYGISRSTVNRLIRNKQISKRKVINSVLINKREFQELVENSKS